jgi:hypothetical protein
MTKVEVSERLNLTMLGYGNTLGLADSHAAKKKRTSAKASAKR